MVNWTTVLKASTSENALDGAKIIANEVRRGFKETRRSVFDGAKTFASEARKSVKETRRKRQIVDRMYPAVVKKLALDRGLHPRALFSYPTVDNYRKAVVSKVPLNDLIDFANRKRIFIRDITEEMNKEISEQDEQDLLEEDSIGDKYRQVFRSIMEFEALKDYRHEYIYQAELFQWLKSRFPYTSIEVQRGSSRPDIVVNGIAIEIKGPTTENELRTVADKCMRYSEHFKSGIIVVLFDVRVNSHLYEEWANSIKKTYGHLTHVEILRK